MKEINVNHHKKKGCSTVAIIVAIAVCFFFFSGYFFVALFSKWTYLALFVFLVWKFRGRIIAKIKGEKFIKTKGNPEEFSINGETKILNPYAGIFISGGAGSGKSKSLIEPLIKESGKKDYTGVIYDFKFPELAQYVETAYQTSEIKRYYFNFEDLSRSHKINPIAPELMTKESFAREFAYTILVNLNPQMISKPDFWTDNATSLLASTFWYLREKHPRYCTLPHAISMILQPNYEALLRDFQAFQNVGK